MKFDELNLNSEVLKGIENAEFSKCTSVQEIACPVALAGKDIMVQSKTGSGKTAVFIISFLEKFLRNKENGKHSSCLIIAPTRELAQQIADDATKLCNGVVGFHIGVFYGGVGYEHQRKNLEIGCDIYVGTPGRLLDFIKSGELKCNRFDTVVIDEADRLFDMGFYEDITDIFNHMPPISERQTMLFSATLDTKVRNIAWKFMNEPKEIEVSPEEITVKNIVQELFHVESKKKFGLLLQLLEKGKPESVLIFTNSKIRAVEVANRLKLNGYNSAFLMGSMPQKQRQRTLDNMKSGKIKILVATDVAARGLQIDDLPLVINYDIPEDFENYVHRIGRTARAGKSGKAITFACEEYVYGLEAIENYIKMKIPVIWLEDGELPVVEDKSTGKDWGVHSALKSKDSKDHKKRISNSKENTVKKKTPKHPDYAKLSNMSQDERLQYYKNQFNLVDKKEKTPKKVSKTNNQYKQKKKQYNNIEKTNIVKSDKINTTQSQQKTKSNVKGGLFSRLWGLMKKK